MKKNDVYLVTGWGYWLFLYKKAFRQNQKVIGMNSQ